MDSKIQPPPLASTVTKAGNPWHGKFEGGSGQLVLANESVLAGALWSGPETQLVKFAGIAVPETDEAEAAAGMLWKNSAILHGQTRRYNPLKNAAVGDNAWLYRDSALRVWRFYVTAVDGASLRLGYKVWRQRFGLFEERIFGGDAAALVLEIAVPSGMQNTYALAPFDINSSQDGAICLLDHRNHHVTWINAPWRWGVFGAPHLCWALTVEETGPEPTVTAEIIQRGYEKGFSGGAPTSGVVKTPNTVPHAAVIMGEIVDPDSSPKQVWGACVTHTGGIQRGQVDVDQPVHEFASDASYWHSCVNSSGVVTEQHDHLVQVPHLVALENVGGLLDDEPYVDIRSSSESVYDHLLAPDGAAVPVGYEMVYERKHTRSISVSGERVTDIVVSTPGGLPVTTVTEGAVSHEVYHGEYHWTYYARRGSDRVQVLKVGYVFDFDGNTLDPEEAGYFVLGDLSFINRIDGAEYDVLEPFNWRGTGLAPAVTGGGLLTIRVSNNLVGLIVMMWNGTGYEDALVALISPTEITPVDPPLVRPHGGFESAPTASYNPLTMGLTFGAKPGWF